MTTVIDLIEKKAKHTSHVIAIISGKGGSGKTMIATSIGTLLAMSGRRVVVMDADIGTGGLTYYFGLGLATRPGLGLARLAAPNAKVTAEDISKLVQDIKEHPGLAFVGLGDHRRLYRYVEANESISTLLSDSVSALRDLADVVVVDCRGGIDPDSLAVCRESDDLLLIVEPDTTSLQAGQHVVDVLAEHDLESRLMGFMINKVFDDPSTISRTGPGMFRCRFLSAVPFDLQATRAFYVGEIPPLHSSFVTQVWQGLHVADLFPPPRQRPWDAKDFREVGLSNADSTRGGMTLAGLLVLIALITGLRYTLIAPIKFPISASVYESLLSASLKEILFISVAIWVLGLLASLEPSRRIVGRSIAAYVRISKRMMQMLLRNWVP